jgi:hypothetical protein
MRGKTVKTDITIRERIVLPLEDRPILRGYQEYRDLPVDAGVRVYSLEEVAVEKTVALLSARPASMSRRTCKVYSNFSQLTPSGSWSIK